MYRPLSYPFRSLNFTLIKVRDNGKNYSFCRLKVLVKKFEHYQLGTNQSEFSKITKNSEPINKNTVIKLWVSISIIYSQMSTSFKTNVCFFLAIFFKKTLERTTKPLHKLQSSNYIHSCTQKCKTSFKKGVYFCRQAKLAILMRISHNNITVHKPADLDSNRTVTQYFYKKCRSKI